MFKENKYTKWYFNIIHSRLASPASGYTEKHHIIPRSLGGSNDLTNLVKLSAREHFVCHLLLIRMVNQEVKHKMVYAAWQQSRTRNYTGYKVTNRIYELLKKQMSESYTGRKRAPFSSQARENMKAGAVNRKRVPVTEERLQSIRAAVSKRERLTGEKNPFYGKTHSKETIEKIREVNSRIYACPYCGKEGASNSMKRWHFDNCKLRHLTHTDNPNDQC